MTPTATLLCLVCALGRPDPPNSAPGPAPAQTTPAEPRTPEEFKQRAFEQDREEHRRRGAELDALIAQSKREGDAIVACRVRSEAEQGYEKFRGLTLVADAAIKDRVEVLTGVRLPAARLPRYLVPRDPDADQSIKNLWAQRDNADIKWIVIDLRLRFSLFYWSQTGQLLPVPKWLWDLPTLVTEDE